MSANSSASQTKAVGLTDEHVQSVFTRAEAHLQSVIDSSGGSENPKLRDAHSALRSMRIYSKSSNGIPGLRGLGLKEALEFAEGVLEHRFQSDLELAAQSYKFIVAGIRAGR